MSPSDAVAATADTVAADSGSARTDAAYKVIRRTGTATPFDPSKIHAAITNAFIAVEGEQASGSTRLHTVVDELTEAVVAGLTRRAEPGQAFAIESIQDQVELALMRGGYHKVARAYVLYREQRAAERAAQAPPVAEAAPVLHVTQADGQTAPLDRERLAAIIREACNGLDGTDPEALLAETERNLYDGISAQELAQAPILAARPWVEAEPNYAFVGARLLLDQLRSEALTAVAGQPEQATHAEMHARYRTYLAAYVSHGIEAGQLDPALASFDLERLGEAIEPDRDLHFQYLGLQTLYDRYLLHVEGERFELPQAFFMRVAMGLALNEPEPEAAAIAFYRLLSSFAFMSSTPTLFNAGTNRPQLSSCFLTTIADDLHGIFKSITDNALLAKFSGGLGNDWTRVRGLGARIRGTNGQSQGIVPFLKIANDTAIGVNQGGKRKGAVCAYLETWHIDVEEFLELRKNTGDERRRTHDMNTAHWIPDLFMERVEANGEWTLFSPDEVPDLHERFGDDFRAAYEHYEAMADRGAIRVYKRIGAVDLWRRMLTMLFETGHPWLTFKDACNLRSPQQHAGVVHSSNLCTEITLNTSDDEVAVCNLGSVNLAAHVTPDGLDQKGLEATVRTAMRMLDNVIDINYYTIGEARAANERHRPVGLGLMGFQDALHTQGIPYASPEAAEFADASMEAISYHALSASNELAVERGAYASFDGSLWSQGVLPIDSLEYLAQSRGGLEIDRSQRFDWEPLRERIRRDGLRNSNTMALAPTATIANICGVSPSIEPTYQNLFVKSNMSGDFTVVNAALVHDLKARGLWDAAMVSDLKYFDGSLAPIERVPDDLKALYATAFEVDAQWLIEAAARRQKWIDQAQSLNLYLATPSGKLLDRIYRHAWRRGLKTTYYLRAQAASHVEKSTLGGGTGHLNAVTASPSADGPSCDPTEADCEACQ